MLNHSLVPVGSTGYDIPYSARFNDNDSAYLSRTPSSAGNRKTWTWSGWVKRGVLTNNTGFFSAGPDSSNEIRFNFFSDQLHITNYIANVRGVYLKSSALYRDTSAWYHIIISSDTTQSTASDRLKIYVNGEQLTSFANSDYPALNFEWWMNTTNAHYVGFGDVTPTYYFDGYLAEVNFIDGQALTPDNFGETGDYGEWKPIKYTGTYGTNGFYLDFENSGSLGADVSGNGNNWTPTNLTANDQMLDSPTNNFATLNPLQRNGTNITVSEGNLKGVGSGGWQTIGCTQAITSGKWYWEVCNINAGLTLVGVVDTENQGALFRSSAFVGNLANSYGYYSGEGKKYNITSTAYGALWNGTKDVVGIAFDADTGTLTFYKNGVSQGVAYTGLTNNMTPAFSPHNSVQLAANFGQDSSFAGNKTSQGNADDNGYGDFYYAPPTGYLALCTQNLPEPTVVPSEHFTANTRTGTGASTSISGIGFAPDFVWLKSRSIASDNGLHDIIRGNNRLISNATAAESANANWTSFDSDGFTLGGGGSGYNQSGTTYVDWLWKANGAGVSNTNGTITSTVSANVDAGFSIVSYTGTGANATVGHGLTKAPEMVIVKSRTSSTGIWLTYHKDNTAAPETDYLVLNTTQATTDFNVIWNDTKPTSSVVNLGPSDSGNFNTYNFIMYAFHSVDGYSKVGSYTGNGSADGTFVHCGFRPAYVMWKATSSSENWAVIDASRDEYNESKKFLRPDESTAETNQSNIGLDFNANGFKIRGTDTKQNGSGWSYIYLAFAEHPFKYSTAK